MTLKLFDQPDDTVEMLKQFETAAGHSGPLDEAMDDDRGYIVNPANTIALVYDEDAAADSDIPVSELTEPATNVVKETKDYTYGRFTFPAGNEAAVTTDHLDTIGEVYDTDLLHQPQRVRSHPDQDQWPIRVDHTESQTCLLVAPVMVLE